MKIDAKKRYLFLVESPNKVKTVSKIFKDIGYNNITVLASVGHITKIADSGVYNMGIDPNNNFKADYKIAEGKRDVVSKLRDQAKAADIVILATDQDREGEAIAYHLIEELKIPQKKIERVTYHEITKTAILKGIENSRQLDLDLVAAATAREKLDKIVGYRLSGIARNNVGARSVGRCQSAGLKIINMREDEIDAFKSETYFDFYVNFSKNNAQFKAKYIGTEKEPVKSLPSLDACKKVADECKKKDFIIKDIVNKDSLENPKPPFITSTFQQEVSKKLGISVKWAMDCAQKLFEGIDIGGNHIPLITYHRTDCSDYAPEFLTELEKYVKTTYGNSYYAPVKFGKKTENEQAGHEGIRCIDLEMTPETLSQYISDDKLLKVYEIIYNRTVASSMKPAIIGNTIYTIENGDHLFSMTSKELKFDGYRRVYRYSDDNSEENDMVIETFAVGEKLQDPQTEAIEKQTKPPVRYDESSFIKQLDKLGIGRPSTYSSILQVILDEKRGYCKVEEKKIVPTSLGRRLTSFLDSSFSDIINLKYTGELERNLDEIASGKMDSVDFLSTFYKNLEESISKVDPTGGQVKTALCPNCGKPMSIKKGRYGLFLGCTGYPECKTIQPFKK